MTNKWTNYLITKEHATKGAIERHAITTFVTTWFTTIVREVENCLHQSFQAICRA
jgi:hypothetical protein